MEKNDRLVLYDEAIRKWGVEAQREMIYEEVGELITAVARHRRGRTDRKGVITELADVTIMCEQLAYMLGYEDYEKEIDEKLKRLKNEKLKLC
jgi:NTP pyrophosphatase (non-canonical NTP hydrolase)